MSLRSSQVALLRWSQGDHRVEARTPRASKTRGHSELVPLLILVLVHELVRSVGKALRLTHHASRALLQLRQGLSSFRQSLPGPHDVPSQGASLRPQGLCVATISRNVTSNCLGGLATCLAKELFSVQHTWSTSKEALEEALLGCFGHILVQEYGTKHLLQVGTEIRRNGELLQL